ncbi:MAG: GAF domain-containing protein, partial [Chloroflexi bacterium]
IINEIGQALAKQLDFDAIIELVGERLRTMFADQARDMFVATFDAKTKAINFPFWIENGERFQSDAIELGEGLTSIVIRSKRPLRLDTLEAAMKLGAIFPEGVGMTESWLGVPIPSGNDVIGAIMLAHPEPAAYSDADERLVSTLASSMGVALENARLFDETKRLLAETDERAAELAIINSVQQGLAQQLDYDAIAVLVGERLASIFDAGDLFVSLFDPQSNKIRYPFFIEAGARIDARTLDLGEGLTSVVIRSRKPLRLGATDEIIARGAVPFGTTGYGTSWIGIPVLAGDAVIGVISLQDHDRENAFSESHERLLTTLASSMGVALENARLFDETKRLLAETDERAAELAIINSVQQGLAERLDRQAMYDLVGDKITEIFDVDGVDIESYDKTTGIVTFQYTVERGERLPADPIPLIGFRRQLVDTKSPVLINRDLPARAAAAGQPAVIAGELAKSALFMPIVAGGEVTGILLIENLEHEDAFSEADVRLLGTIASSLSVALENVRLFDETKRLLVEADSRAAELAVVNEIGLALAEQLDFQAIIDLVGERVRSIFEPQSLFIALYEEATNRIRFAYSVDAGERMTRPDIDLGPGLTSRIIQTRKPVRIGSDDEANALGALQVGGSETESFLGVPILSADRVIGVVALERLERNAYGESDERLLSTLATSMGVALENARLFDETKRLLTETDERAAELAVVNSVQQGLAAKLDMQSMYDLVMRRPWTSPSTTSLLTLSASRMSSNAAFGWQISRCHSSGRAAESSKRGHRC